MTINKTQGQTLPIVGVYLPKPARMLIPKPIALGILCIPTSLELDAFYSIDILFVNRLVIFILSSCSVSLNCISILRHL
jgi:hypothetical protein